MANLNKLTDNGEKESKPASGKMDILPQAEAGKKAFEQIDLSDKHYVEAFKDADIYQKSGTVEAEFVDKPQEVVTMIGDNEETRQTAEPGQVIVTNPSGERYVLDKDTFDKRYETTDKDGEYRANGKARIMQNDTGKPIEIVAPWGELQRGDADCMIAALYDPKKPYSLSKDRYIIAKDAFEATYEPTTKWGEYGLRELGNRMAGTIRRAAAMGGDPDNYPIIPSDWVES
ncbi:PGDYG domain-containing protein [Candidatus Saccharibacteria bacterium]|nr:PGDYG domain-containing protein [Candidatus Saccharibacteria bacterium]